MASDSAFTITGRQAMEDRLFTALRRAVRTPTSELFGASLDISTPETKVVTSAGRAWLLDDLRDHLLLGMPLPPLRASQDSGQGDPSEADRKRLEECDKAVADLQKASELSALVQRALARAVKIIKTTTVEPIAEKWQQPAGTVPGAEEQVRAEAIAQLDALGPKLLVPPVVPRETNAEHRPLFVQIRELVSRHQMFGMRGSADHNCATYLDQCLKAYENSEKRLRNVDVTMAEGLTPS